MHMVAMEPSWEWLIVRGLHPDTHKGLGHAPGTHSPLPNVASSMPKQTNDAGSACGTIASICAAIPRRGCPFSTVDPIVRRHPVQANKRMVSREPCTGRVGKLKHLLKDTENVPFDAAAIPDDRSSLQAREGVRR